MATRNEHIAQAEKNEKIAPVLVTGYPDWAVTVYFYAALHYVQAYLASIGQRIEYHDERRVAMRQNYETKRILKEYDLLQSLSRQARYDARPVTAEDVHAAQQYFAAVRNHLRGVLRLP